MAGERFLTRLADASIAAILVEGAKPIGTWLIPWTLSAVAFGVGVFQQPLVYVIAAASLTFAAVTTALLRYDKWRFLRSPRDKVIFVQVGLYIDYVYDRPTGEITGIQKMQIGAFFENRAIFPIWCVIEQINSSIEGRIDPNAPSDRGIMEIAPKSTKEYRDTVIEASNENLKPALNGRLKFRIRYGIKGREKYILEKDLTVYSTYDATTGTYRGPIYTEPPTN